MGGDFLAMNPNKLGMRFDRIYANPPFEEGQDMDHVRHMYGALAQYGWLISVMSPHFYFAADRKAASFREWFKRVDGTSCELVPKSFVESGTGVNTWLVQVQRKDNPNVKRVPLADFDL
jgi:hypothetical protein